NLMVGGEIQNSITTKYTKYESAGMPGSFYEYDESARENPDVNAVQIDRDGDEIYRFVSAFTRLKYSIKDKYFLEATGRVDGSSRFGTNNKYGFFPSLSGGWVMSEENFLKNNKVINFMKLRGSWGVSGNANIPNYESWGTVIPANFNPYYNGQPIIYPNRLANPNLKWERSNVYDISLQMGLWEDRVTMEVSAYYKDTRDVLMKLTVPSSSGFNDYWDNVGRITNQGVEFELKSVNISKKKFTWSTNFNIAHNQNEIKSIGDYSEDAVSGGTNDTRVVVGEPVGTNYLVKFSHVDSENGRPVYLDLEGNETYEWLPNNRVPVGNILPKAVGGLTNTFKLDNWDFSFLLYYSFGSKIYDSSSKRQLGVVTDWNMRDDIYDRWQQPGDDATYPRLTLNTQTYGSGTPWINTDLWLHSGDYVRLRNVTLGYTFNGFKFLKRQFTDLRVACIATNWLTWTTFPGLDPEIGRDFENSTDRNMSPNITYLTPPQEKSIVITINAKF
ncbi:MAG: TonB-dependent receptor, partial [Bacteroidetes bacterium]|nr:TonB-dependent receptor [Bacteroidota bacterium]